MEIELKAAGPENAEQFRECLDAVAKEEKFLLITSAPPIEVIAKSIAEKLKNLVPNIFAFDGPNLVGWCDLRATDHAGAAHRAELAMGVRKNYRGRGIGRKLIERCTREAKSVDFEKIELLVFEDNKPAIRLYEDFGFRPEGRILKYRKMNGVYTDVILMGLFLAEYNPGH